MRHAICYISNSEENLDLGEIRLLLDISQERNDLLDIKGILLYSEGHFFQILEGERQRVLDLFEKIKKDTRHYGIIQVLGQDIEQGSYDGYKVGVINEGDKFKGDLPEDYTKALNGIAPEPKMAMERMLETFIATR